MSRTARRPGLLATLRSMHPLDRRDLLASVATVTLGGIALVALLAGAATLL